MNAIEPPLAPTAPQAAPAASYGVAGSLLAMAVTSAEMLTVAFGVGTPVHPALSILFMMTCPGLVLLDVVRLPDHASRLMVAVGASVIFNVIVSSALLVADVWSAPMSVAATGVVTALGAGIQSWRATTERRRARTAIPGGGSGAMEAT
jgi:hypothetical protein